MYITNILEMICFPHCDGTQKFTFVWSILKHGIMHRQNLYLEHWNLIVVCLFLAAHACACTHTQHCKHDPVTGQCSICWASRWVIWLACGCGLPLGVGWGRGFLALISNRFWTKVKQTFLWYILILQD